MLELVATLPELAATLPELAVTCYKLIKLAEFGRIYLSSVSPRYSYCNWASPVTYIAEFLKALHNQATKSNPNLEIKKGLLLY